jgi:hypothetical protein
MPAHIGSRDDEAFHRLIAALAQARRDGLTFREAWRPAVRSANFTETGRMALHHTKGAWRRGYLRTANASDQVVAVVVERIDA